VDGHLYIGASVLGNLEEDSSTGDFESIKASRDRHLFLQRLRLGNLEESLSTGTLRVGRRGFVSLPWGTPWWGSRGELLYWETWKMKSLRDTRKALRSGLPLYSGPLGNLEGLRLSVLLREINSVSEYLFVCGGYSGFKSGLLAFGPRR